MQPARVLGAGLRGVARLQGAGLRGRGPAPGAGLPGPGLGVVLRWLLWLACLPAG